MNHEPGFHLSCDEHLSEGWGPPLKSRAIFDRYNIINEQELLDAGDQLVEYLAQQAQAVPARRRPHPAGTAAPRTARALRLVRRTTA